MPKREGGRLDPEEVLRGRLRPGPTALCALVRAVNPSGLNLPAAERTRRYAVKSRLQSLLIERFHDEIDVVPDGPPGSGVVLLRHRPSGEAAGHAILAELDEEARSRVRRMLDLQESEARGVEGSPPGRREAHARHTRGHHREPMRAGAPAPAETVDELLDAGRRATAEYDYEAARSAFEAALDRSDGAIAPALALLDLLVEQLGADEDALAVEASLSAAALGDPAVRGRLAVAAARSGAREKALSLARGLRDDRAAEVLAALARNALSAGDLTCAASDLAALRRQSPAHGELRALEDALEAARRPLFRPVEEELTSLVAAGRFEEAEALARALPAGTSRSEAVRGAVRAIDEHKRRARVADVLARAESALGGGDPMTAIGLLRQVQAGDPEIEKARVAEVLGAAEAAERARADATAAEGVSKRLAGGDTVEGLAAYVALSPSARALVRAAAPRAELDLLDQTGASGTGARARAAALAVIAFTRAEVIADDDPEGAAALVRPHLRELHGARALQRLAQKIEHARREEQREEARRRILSACEVLDELTTTVSEGRKGASVIAELGKVAARARALLPDSVIEILDDEEERWKASNLRDQIETLCDRAQLFGQLGALAQKGDAREARAFVEASVAARPHAPGDLAPALRRTAERLIRDRFRACAAGEGARDLARRGLARAVVTDAPMRMPHLWGAPHTRTGGVERSIRGRELIQIQSRGRLAFVRTVDLRHDVPSPRRVAIFRTPEPARISSGDAARGTVTAVGSFGALLTISVDDARVLAWRPPVPQPAGAAEMPEYAPPWFVLVSTFTADLRFLWTLETPADAPSRIRVLDTETMRVTHEERMQPTGIALETLLGAQEADVAILGQPRWPVDLRRADGAPVPGGCFSQPVVAMSVTACPGGGVFALARTNEGEPCSAVRLLPGAAEPAPTAIDGLTPGPVIGAATDLSGGRVFLLHEVGEQRLLTALLPEGDGFVISYQIPVPPRSMLVLDVESHQPSLLAVTRRAFQVLALSDRPPVVPAHADEPPLLFMPRTRQFGMVCNEINGPRPAAVDRWVRETSEVNKAGIARLLRGLVQRGDADALCDFARALDLNDEPVRALEVIGYTFRNHPDHAFARLQAARVPAGIGAWAKVRELLEGRTDAGLEGHAARHFGHLLGLALMDAGRHDEALPVLLRAQEHEGPCELDALIALASPGDEAEGDASERRAMRELLRVVAAADARLSAGEAVAAIGILDDAVVWEAREVQSMARFARAFLSAGDELPPALQIQKLFALATYAELHEDRTSNRREIFSRDRWSVEVLDSLQAEAKAWMDAFTSRCTIEEPGEPASGS